MNLETIKTNTRQAILRFSIPSILAMILTSLITIIDGFFIGNYIGSEGLAAVNLGLPIVYLYLAIGLMISVGGVAIAGMLLGKQDHRKANDVFNQTQVTTLCIVLTISILIWIFFDPIVTFLQAKEQVSINFKDYYQIMLLELPLMVINSSLCMFIRGEGQPQFVLKVNAITVLLNILLDAFFIHQNLGVFGIALASLIAALITTLLILHYFLKKSTIYKLRSFPFSKEVCFHTVLNGSSEFISEISLCISMLAYNYVIMKYIGTDGVSAFTVVGYTNFLFSMVLIGFGQGASPLISFAYGAGDIPLAKHIRKLTNKLVCIAGIIVFLFLTFGSSWYSQLFIQHDVIQTMIQTGVVIHAISFLFSGINTITSFYFTSIGKAKESAIISASRGFVCLLLCIFIFPAIWGLTGVWLVAPITEILTIGFTFYFIHTDHLRK